jgi:hypothetical protein
MIVDRVERFVRDPGSGDFEELAREAFRYQYEGIEAYRGLCERQGLEPDGIADWRQIPVVPAMAYKSVDLSIGEGGEIFRSSGTTKAIRSVHRHAFLDLYRATIESSFPKSVLGSLERRPILSLIPNREQAPDSSLSFMADHVVRKWGDEESQNAFGANGVEARLARSFLGARQRDQRPILILSTAFALVQLLEALDRFHLRFRLPTGSTVFETGGYKGRSRIVPPGELIERLDERLALLPGSIIREYGMTELTSQFYTSALVGGDADLFQPPHWTRVRILDPETLEEAAPGRTGLICILDLANLSSAIHLLTEDLGVAEEGGFRLLGRAAGAELRGCSLTVEELSQS